MKSGDERFDVLLGALAEHLAYHHDFPAAEWTTKPERLWIGVADPFPPKTSVTSG